MPRSNRFARTHFHIVVNNACWLGLLSDAAAAAAADDDDDDDDDDNDDDWCGTM